MPSCAVSLGDYKGRDSKKRRDGVCTLKGGRSGGQLCLIFLSVLSDGTPTYTTLGEIQGNYLHWIYRDVGEKK